MSFYHALFCSIERASQKSWKLKVQEKNGEKLSLNFFSSFHISSSTERRRKMKIWKFHVFVAERETFDLWCYVRELEGSKHAIFYCCCCRDYWHKSWSREPFLFSLEAAKEAEKSFFCFIIFHKTYFIKCTFRLMKIVRHREREWEKCIISLPGLRIVCFCPF